MEPEFPNSPSGALDPDEMLANVYRRGGRLKLRRRVTAIGMAMATAGAAAGLLLTLIPGSSPHQVVSTGRTTPSTASTALASCPESPFVVKAPASGAVSPTPDFTSGAYRQLAAGQTAVLFSDRAPGDKEIWLTRGVDTSSFAVSVWAHGPNPLTPVAVLGNTAMLFPAGEGEPGARIPFRYPQVGAPNDPCERYQLQAIGLDDYTLIQLAENIRATTGTPATSATTTPSLDNSVFTQPLAGPASATITASGLYVDILNLTATPVSSELNRVDPTSGRVEATAQLGAQFDQAVEISGSLWVTTSTTNNKTLIRLNPQTLAVTGRWTLGDTPDFTNSDMAVVGGGLWIAAGDRLLRLSLPDGSVTTSLSLPGADTSSVTTNPQGTILVDAEAKAGSGAVQRRDPTTGRLLASFPMNGVTAPRLTGIIGSSVWVSESTGMMGYVERLDATSMQPSAEDLTNCRDGYMGPTCISGTNGITATAANGLIWITQVAGGSSRNYCAIPSSGKALASLTLPQPDEDSIAAIGPNDIYYAYYATNANHLGRQALPTGCQPSSS